MCKQTRLQERYRNGASETDAQDAAAMVLIDPMSKADELLKNQNLTHYKVTLVNLVKLRVLYKI